MPNHSPIDPDLLRLPKICGGDIELGNFVVGGRGPANTCAEASKALLEEIDGLPRAKRYHPPGCRCTVCVTRWRGIGWRWPTVTGAAKQPARANGATGQGAWNPQDRGRRYLPSNGGCVYIDLNHLELCLPEVRSAVDHVACWHAMLRIARQAQVAANNELERGREIRVLVNNSDGFGNSYGSHLDFLISRRAWRNLFQRKLHQLLFLASFQVSSVIITGQGKVGSENGMPHVDFQLSQRADFFETLLGAQTTFRRPLVNSRDEALCGFSGTVAHESPRALMARLHVIFFDATLCHVASLLKVGMMQIVLAMIEAEQIEPRLILDDPVGAAVRISHDPTLGAVERTASGRELTALELQGEFLEAARGFHDRGGLEGIVEGAEQILDLWQDTLIKLAAGDLEALAPRLDWALKRLVLERALEQHRDLGWLSPEIKHLDQVYASLDPADGLYWAYENSGMVERVVFEEQIDYFVAQPPEETRAWTRAMLLRRAGAERVADVDWDLVRVVLEDGSRRTVELDDPCAMGRNEAAPTFDAAQTLDDLVAALAPGPDRESGSKTESVDASTSLTGTPNGEPAEAGRPGNAVETIEWQPTN